MTSRAVQHAADEALAELALAKLQDVAVDDYEGLIEAAEALHEIVRDADSERLLWQLRRARDYAARLAGGS